MSETNVTTREPAERPVIGGKYVLDKLLGQGGYSWVYLAKHKQIPDLQYVVKLLKPSHLGNDQVLRRFEQEATTLARLRSPRIVRIVDYGPTEAGIPYIVSEYIDGVTMGLVLREHGKLSPWLAAHLGCQVLEGLVDAHNAGFVHRDLKPDNVLITRPDNEPFPEAMILDFGIAKVTQQAADDADATVEGLACSPRYAAPEVLTREPTVQSDLYAMGLVLAEMLTGHPVFRGKHNLILASEQLSSEKVPLPEEVLTSPLGSIIARACEKPLSKRYATAQDMLEELREMRQTLNPFSEAARTEIDLPALITARNERPISEADTTALTANLHTYEARNTGTGSGTVNVDIDQLVAAQKATRVNRVLLPVLIVAVLLMLGVIGWIVLNMNNGGTSTASTETSNENAVPASAGGPEAVVSRARNNVRQALVQASVNNISISTDVPNAELWIDDTRIGALPLQNVVTDNLRPLDLTVKADGYDDVTLQVIQTGRVALQARLNEESEPEVVEIPTDRSGTRRTTAPSQPRSERTNESEAPSEPAQRSEPSRRSSGSSEPARRGDYFENPF